tara:strand:- start:924 stop:2567 length:1644 start_codon:yes stop_codon:yes gene_type:complete
MALGSPMFMGAQGRSMGQLQSMGQPTRLTGMNVYPDQSYGIPQPITSKRPAPLGGQGMPGDDFYAQQINRRPQSQFGGYNPYSQPQSQFGGYNPYSQGGLGGGFGGRYGGRFGASPMRYQGGNYGGGMGQIMPTNIPYRDPGYGSPMRTQNLIQNMGGPQSFRDPYRNQSTMDQLDNFRGNQYGSPQAGMPPMGGRPGGKGGRAGGQGPSLPRNPGSPDGQYGGGQPAGGRPGGKGGRGGVQGGLGETPVSNTSDGLMTGDPAPAVQPPAPLEPLTDSRLTMNDTGQYTFTGADGNVLNDLTRSGAQSMLDDYSANPENYQASPQDQGLGSTTPPATPAAPAAPVWPAPGSRHPETGETQEEISARWKVETQAGKDKAAADAAAAAAAAAATAPPAGQAQVGSTQVGPSNFSPEAIAAMEAAGVDPSKIMQDIGNFGGMFASGGQVGRRYMADGGMAGMGGGIAGLDPEMIRQMQMASQGAQGDMNARNQAIYQSTTPENFHTAYDPQGRGAQDSQGLRNMQMRQKLLSDLAMRQASGSMASGIGRA